MTAPDVRRIAILEDDPAIRDHFSEIIGSSDDLALCATASMIAEVSLLIAGRPDLLLTDIGLPDGNGLDVLPAIKAATGCRALVITAFGDRDTVVAAMKAGADGYLLKDSPATVILDGIRVTLDGGAPISPAAAVYLLERLRAAPTPSRREDPSEPLTTRETELLTIFARGLSYKEAARILGISPLTVGNHVKSIYRKLEVNSRGEAVYEAVRQGRLDIRDGSTTRG
ncbi:Transcriptional regulatory protein DegU [Brevundimonas sp. NIBR10]|uniref:response regulator n=1 Tax=Brevundimonas sp. NIBR10 TaxID=3015997 RepID=UPI0022F16EE4|nr:response regulator transcription factor [Brevundimonas sp. NIBR10]WGM45500.1 Transcriptional regulatory protein DegU [Brevundimonas sp. NIBR10]